MRESRGWRWLAATAGCLTLAACGGEAEQQQAAGSGTDEGPPKTGLRNGEAFEVVLDSCPFDDTGWTPETDPLGTISCGATYTVRYVSVANEWYARGPSEAELAVRPGSQPIQSNADDPGDPDAFSIWGAVFTATADGKVIDKEGRHVGHIRTATKKAEGQAS